MSSASKTPIHICKPHVHFAAEEISPEIFKGTYNNTIYEPLLLEDLDLSHNQIHSLPHNIFEHLTTLKQLNLAGNSLRVLDPPTQMALSGLANLQVIYNCSWSNSYKLIEKQPFQVLNIADNDLTDLVGNAVRNLQKLRILNLTMNRLDFVPETLSLLSNSLEAVYLDQNLIFEITDESFLGNYFVMVALVSIECLILYEWVKGNSFATLLSFYFFNQIEFLTLILKWMRIITKNYSVKEILSCDQIVTRKCEFVFQTFFWLRLGNAIYRCDKLSTIFQGLRALKCFLLPICPDCST